MTSKRVLTDSQKRKLDRLAELMADVDPERLRTATTKDRYLTIRITASDLEDIRATAKGLGMTVTEYITGLHLFARDGLKARRAAGKDAQ